MPLLLKIDPLGTGLSYFSALGNGGRHAASTFCYHSELDSIISFGKYPLFYHHFEKTLHAVFSHIVSALEYFPQQKVSLLGNFKRLKFAETI